jgi:hypothetical protein
MIQCRFIIIAQCPNEAVQFIVYSTWKVAPVVFSFCPRHVVTINPIMGDKEISLEEFLAFEVIGS